MRAEIIAVGTEILMGQIVNTNASYLADYLTQLGFDMYHQQVVGDNESRLLAVLDEASKRSELVVLCGGLGPTEDDLTKQTTAKFLGKELFYDSEAAARLEEFFSVPFIEVTENNKRQALAISGGTTIQNPAGLACGVLYQGETTSYLLLPGPPREMEAVTREATTLLKELLPNDHHLYSSYLRFMGIGESKLAEVLEELIINQTNPTLATYAKSNEVMLRITAKCDNALEGDELIKEMEALVFEKVGNYFYGYGENLTIEEVVIDLLKEKKQTLSVVEGVSGGLCQGRLTDVPGSSEVFEGGVVTYSAKSKLKLIESANLDVSVLNQISEKQAIELAKAIQQTTNTTYGLSIIGAAGKEGLDGYPMGTIFIAFASEKEVISKKLLIKRERDYIKDGAVKHGLNLLRKQLI